MLTRQIFEFNDTGTSGDTGAAFWGEIAQMHWHPDAADTGADLQLHFIPAQGDTGDTFEVYNETDSLSSAFTRVPRQPGHSSDGTDTGVDEYFPIVGAGDRINAKVVSGATSAIQGRLYLWIREH